ncbi:MAG: ribosome-associated translation inhibitor RaiA, partial [Methylococcales bacterium]|nr:ribosome-associated translation inhibitor RaiA [Methylococcales bacterium]
MQTSNVNTPITVTGRHVKVTEAMRDHAEKKLAGIHLDYPKIIEAKVILNVEKDRHQAEIILFCANHIVIEADSSTKDMYTSIDETIQKITRRMRKYKTKMLKSHRPKQKEDVHHFNEEIFLSELPEAPVDDLEPTYVHREKYKLRPLYTDEAIEELEMSEKP